MNKHLILTLATAMTVGVAQNASAQWLKALGDKAAEAAKRTVERNVESKTEKAVDDAMNPKFNKKGKSSSSSESSDESYSNKSKASKSANEEVDNTPDAVAQNQKSDFVRGSVILFEDDFANEQMGEFPSKWDISDGSLRSLP